MSVNAGVLMYKRFNCKGKTCYVYKSGRCVNVASAVNVGVNDVYRSIWNTENGDMTKQNMRFGELAEKLLKEGADAACNERDQKLATSGIMAY
jgi:hypothetical protein